MSISYTDLIVEAVVSYGEVKGTSKEDLWKATVSKKPEADLKQFTLRLKKLLEQGVLKSSNYRITKKEDQEMVKEIFTRKSCQMTLIQRLA